MWLPRHVAVAAAWLPRHVAIAVAAVWFETKRQLTNCTGCTRDELSGTCMAPSRERREGPAGGDRRDERGIVYLSTAVQNQLDQVGWSGR